MSEKRENWGEGRGDSPLLSPLFFFSQFFLLPLPSLITPATQAVVKLSTRLFGRDTLVNSYM